MKPRILMLSSLLIMFPLLSGCYELKKIWLNGTVKGVASCINHLSQSAGLLSESLIKRECVEENENNVPYEYFEASAWTTTNEDSVTINLSGGQNTIEDYVLSTLRVKAILYDAEGKMWSGIGLAKVWIEPYSTISGTANVQFEFPKQEYSSWCSETSEKKSCKSWALIDFKGVRVSN